MKVKVVMNSGKEYVVCKNDFSLQDFTRSFYDHSPEGEKVLKNSLIFLDEDESIVINPAHISSLEVIHL